MNTNTADHRRESAVAYSEEQLDKATLIPDTTSEQAPGQAWEALGLAEFPIVTTAVKQPPRNSLEFTEKTSRRGKVTERRWSMVASEEYGLPRLYDLDLYVAILVLAERTGYETRLIKTTIHELCTIPRLTPGGATYDRVRQGVRRFIHTGYSACGVFWPEGAQQPIAVEEWHILAEARLLPSYQDQAVQDGLPPSYILLGEKFLNILKREKRKPINLGLWRQVGTGIAKPLFHYLDTALYNRDRFEIGLNRLGNHIGQTTRYAPSQMLRQYGPYLQRFVDLGFLKSFRFEKARSDRDPYKLVVVPGENARRNARRATQVRNHSQAGNATSQRDIERNLAYSEVKTDGSQSLVLLREAYQKWCGDETERRLRLLGSAHRETLLAEAAAELGQGRHEERIGTWHEHYRRRMAENKVRRKLGQDLPSFEEWRNDRQTAAL